MEQLLCINNQLGLNSCLTLLGDGNGRSPQMLKIIA